MSKGSAATALADPWASTYVEKAMLNAPKSSGETAWATRTVSVKLVRLDTIWSAKPHPLRRKALLFLTGLARGPRSVSMASYRDCLNSPTWLESRFTFDGNVRRDGGSSTSESNAHLPRSPTAIKDKKGILPRLADVSLELGCGPRKRNPKDIGIDALDYDDVDIVGDVYEVLGRIESGVIDRISSYHFLEHVDDLPRLVTEMARVLKPSGLLEAVVPHFSNPYYYSDYTHRNPFGLYSFSYMADGGSFRRTVPRYADPQFRLDSVRLGFKSARPFYGRFAIKKSFGLLVNSCSYAQEFYEENLCYIIPCYELTFRLHRFDDI